MFPANPFQQSVHLSEITGTTQEIRNANPFTPRMRNLPQKQVWEKSYLVRINTYVYFFLKVCQNKEHLFVNAGTKSLFSDERVISHRKG